MTVGLTLGAPGVYVAPAVAAPSTPAAIDLDETGLVGVCWRGPVQTPVPVTSWSQFVDVFGGTTAPDGTPCPGYLPVAVRAFFDQGGRTAWVVRVAPVAPAADAAARLDLPGLGVGLMASAEGSWGRLLSATMSFRAGPPLPQARVRSAAHDDADPRLAIGSLEALPAGSLLLIGRSAGRPAGSLHWLRSQSVVRDDRGGRVRVVELDPPPPAGADTEQPPDLRVVTATLEVLDRDPQRRRSEQIAGLGLHPDHPRYPAHPVPPEHPRHPEPVLAVESLLVRPGSGWDRSVLPPDATLPAVVTQPASGGRDRFEEIDERSFFDDDSPDGDRLDERRDHRGVDALGRVPSLGLACVPDVAWSGERYRLGLAAHLDPHARQELTEIIDRQRRLVAVAELRQRFVALLDAPARMSVDELGRWRSNFDSSFAAAYHPWLRVPAGDPRDAAVPVPPSAFGAGIIAAREIRLGLAWGPANELASTAVVGVDVVPPAAQDDLHRDGVNVFHAERDGYRLASARTLSRDPRYAQLTVRRLMTMIVLTLERQAEWLVFEPHTPQLRVGLFHTLTQFLRELFQRGALAGDTEETSFFVRCDGRLNPADSVASGRLVAEVGIALSSPLEFLVVRITQDSDGRTRVVTNGSGGSP